MNKAILISGLVALAVSNLSWAGGTHGSQHQNAEAKVDREIQVEAKDIRFVQDKLELRQGETVRFVVTNTGQIPHEFILGSKEMQDEHRQMMAAMAAAGHGDHAHDMGEMVGVTVAPGETQSFVWTATEAGQLHYACNIPGHYEAGMHGQLQVQ